MNKPFNPFDHGACDHPPIRWPADISPSVNFDLLEVFQKLWDFISLGLYEHALMLLDAVGYLMTQSAMGNQDQIEADYVKHLDIRHMQESARDVDWDDELRKLLGGNQ